MRKVLKLALFVIIFLSCTKVMADRFVPNFREMKKLVCDVNENIYELDNTLVTSSRLIRTYNLDDENSKIYQQKAPVDKILHYDADIIKFKVQNMTDDFIMDSIITIDRQNYNIEIKSSIDYDNTDFHSRYAVSSGKCNLLD